MVNVGCVNISLVPYHHGNLREALVDAGVALAEAEGQEAVTLRAVSRKVGVSHNAAYRHFSDGDALMRALAARALTLWARLVEERIAQVGSRRGRKAAWDRINAAGRAYVEFAVSSPGLFQLACSPSLGSVEPDEPVAHPYAQLSARLDELVEVGAITPARRADAEIAAWSAVHGFAMLVLDGPLREVPAADREGLLEEVLRVVREGI